MLGLGGGAFVVYNEKLVLYLNLVEGGASLGAQWMVNDRADPVAYTEIDIRVDPQAEARLRRWTGGPLITPVFDIDGRIVIDFKQAELEQALGLR